MVVTTPTAWTRFRHTFPGFLQSFSFTVAVVPRCSYLLSADDLAWFWVWEHRCFPVSVVADSVPVSVSLWLCGRVLASTTGYSRSVWLGPSLGLRNAW